MNTGTIIFLAVLAIIIAAPAIVIAVAVKKLNANRLIRTAAYTLSNGGFQQFDDRPRSLNGCESIYLSQIRSDFPDFDPTAVYTEAKRALKKSSPERTRLRYITPSFPGTKRLFMKRPSCFRRRFSTVRAECCFRNGMFCFIRILWAKTARCLPPTAPTAGHRYRTARQGYAGTATRCL